MAPLSRRSWLRKAGVFVPAAFAITRTRGQIVVPATRLPVAGAATYSASSAVFDGTNDNIGSVAMSGDADTKVFLASLWFKKGVDDVNMRLYNSSTNRILIQFAADNTLTGQFRNASGTNICLFSVPAITGTSWHHIAISFDLANSSNRAIYLDGATASPTWSTYSNDTIDCLVSTVYIGSSTAGANRFNGELCEPWLSIYEASYFDITNAANLQKFRSASGCPVDLGSDGSTPTGTKPHDYIRSWTGASVTNAAGYGNYTISGSLGTGTPPTC